MTSERTHFDLFELPQCYALDADELERRYRERSRHWHPDRFSRAPAISGQSVRRLVSLMPWRAKAG